MAWRGRQWESCPKPAWLIKWTSTGTQAGTSSGSEVLLHWQVLHVASQHCTRSKAGTYQASKQKPHQAPLSLHSSNFHLLPLGSLCKYEYHPLTNGEQGEKLILTCSRKKKCKVASEHFAALGHIHKSHKKLPHEKEKGWK